MQKESLTPKKNNRNSKQRQAILELLSVNKGHLAAETIYQEVRQEQPNISLGTVYRNLDTLSEMGLIRRCIFADGKSRYELESDDHHHHMVCLRCGNIVDLTQCPMDPGMLTYFKSQGFQPVHHHFEVYGYCKNCVLLEVSEATEESFHQE